MKKIVLVLGLVMGSMIASDAFAYNSYSSAGSSVSFNEPSKEVKKKKKSKKGCCKPGSEAASATKGHCSSAKSSCCSKKKASDGTGSETPAK